MSEFITLTCPSCGGKLESTQDIDRFVCSHCGKEHLVKRRRGVVSLLHRVEVEVGVDKTATELAIVQLQKEIGELQAKRTSLLQLSPRPAIRPIFVVPFVLGCILASIFLSSLMDNNTVGSIGFLIGVALISIGTIYYSRPNTKHWDETTGVQIKSMDGQLTEKKAELNHYQNVE